MDLRRMRTFVTVVEQGGVSKASVRMRTAQPALSRQIIDFESELGVKLFDRVRRRLVLTTEGEQLLGECRVVLGAVEGLAQRAHLLRKGESGVLRVAATPQMIEGVFATFLHKYAQRRPNVHIKLTEASGPGLLAKLERGEAHVGIGLMLHAGQADNYAIKTYPLPPIEFLAASKDPLEVDAAGNVDLKRLGLRPLLLLDPSFWVRSTFDAACRLAKFAPNIYLESHTPHTLLALAEAGHGVAVVPSVLPTNRYRLRIARLALHRRPLREPLAVLWDTRRAIPPYARDFSESLAAHMRESFPISRPSRRPKTAQA